MIGMPDLTTWVAGLLGIGRGADLVMYLFMLAAPAFWFRMQTQYFGLQRHVVQLARAEAIRGARRTESGDFGPGE